MLLMVYAIQADAVVVFVEDSVDIQQLVIMDKIRYTFNKEKNIW
jgi:hypothetical protein